jgi:parvulin-like peptidyl-prolyl isomerase
MKKLVNRIRKKKPASIVAEKPSTRITNETVAAHRERILAGGRKFKYPLQTPKHRIVLVTVLIVVFVIATFFGIFTWSLYGGQNTSQFAQRLTQVLPYPVASVDGQQVRYSDYLLELRSALHYLQTKENVSFSSEDGKRQLEYQKRLSLNKAIENAYVSKIAKQQGTKVSDSDVNDFVKQEISNNQLGVNEQVFRQVIRDYYDWSFDEYKTSVRNQLLRKKVIAKLDTVGRQKIDSAVAEIHAGKDFGEVAKAMSDDPTAKATGGDVGLVAVSSDDPNGLIKAAQGLKPGEVSNVIEGADGFYIVKLIETKGSSVHFLKLFVTYTTFNQKLSQLKKENKVQEYIKVAESVKTSNQ